MGEHDNIRKMMIELYSLNLKLDLSYLKRHQKIF